MKLKIKDPGSAITHFIGVLFALIGAIPLLLKASQRPGNVYLISMSIFMLSMVLLYAASTTYHLSLIHIYQREDRGFRVHFLAHIQGRRVYLRYPVANLLSQFFPSLTGDYIFPFYIPGYGT